ncbi:MAG: hypothetical protein JO332_09810 [Planctomycetaceae bacterium]|nr:hypothetical protein [Planctomycetaceae bacterium]
MADYFQSVVDPQAALDQADHLARHVVAWLAEQGVVRATPSEQGGYDRGPQALSIARPEPLRPGHESIPPVHSHLQVLIGRMTHPDDLSEFHEPRACCPSCAKPADHVDGEWQAATQDWVGGDDDAVLRCAACGKETPVIAWVYDRRYAYGNLAFRFWNWPPLKPSFLDELRRELGHPLVLVEGKL